MRTTSGPLAVAFKAVGRCRERNLRGDVCLKVASIAVLIVSLCENTGTAAKSRGACADPRNEAKRNPCFSTLPNDRQVSLTHCFAVCILDLDMEW